MEAVEGTFSQLQKELNSALSSRPRIRTNDSTKGSSPWPDRPDQPMLALSSVTKLALRGKAKALLQQQDLENRSRE